MKVVQKRMIAAGCIGVLVIGGAVVVSRHSTQLGFIMTCAEMILAALRDISA